MSDRPPPSAPGSSHRRLLVAALLAAALITSLLVVARTTFSPVHPVPTPPAKTAAPTTLTVVATDGDDLQVWLAQNDQTTLLAQPAGAQAVPGPADLRILRRTDAGPWRADEVRLTLQPGQTHLVSVGDAPISASILVDGRPVALAARYLPPGPVGLTPGAWHLVARTAASPAGAKPPAFTPNTDLTDPWIAASDRVLLIANPYAQSLTCRVDAQGWQRDLALPGHACRVVAVGETARVETTVRLPGGPLLETRTLDLDDSHLRLYTVGGTTRWRLGESGHLAMPAAPAGALAALPSGARVRLPTADDPPHWLLAVEVDATTFGLSPIACAPPLFKGAVAPVTLRNGMQVTEIAAPANLRQAVVADCTTDGRRLLAVCDGRVYDFASGAPLCAGGEAIARACASPAGLVLLTQSGRLATIADGRLQSGAMLGDPTLRLAPCFGGKPALWLYGDALKPGTLIKHYLGGGESLVFDTSPAGQAQAITCCLPCKSGALMAHGRRIDRHALTRQLNQAHHRSQPVLLLPEPGPPVIGLADLDGRLVFATRDGVYLLNGDVVAPLAEGIGGPLQPWQGGLLVHDAGSHRLFHLTGPAVAPRAAAQAPVTPETNP